MPSVMLTCQANVSTPASLGQVITSSEAGQQLLFNVANITLIEKFLKLSKKVKTKVTFTNFLVLANVQ